MVKPTTPNPHYAALNAQLAVLCDAFHYAVVRAEIEAICAQAAGSPISRRRYQ